MTNEPIFLAIPFFPPETKLPGPLWVNYLPEYHEEVEDRSSLQREKIFKLRKQNSRLNYTVTAK